MIVTLSEERNEKLLVEWSGEITDKHAQDFCDVCNAVMFDHFDSDYMRRRYCEETIYGKSFVVIVYKDEAPVACLGAWRIDFDGRPAFSLIDFASLPTVRKGGYPLDMLYAIFDEVRNIPGAITYAVIPGKMSFPLYKALGFALKDMYLRLYSGPTRDFLENMPMVEDDYAEAFYLKKKGAYVRYLGGKPYLVLQRRLKRIVPAGLILGQLSGNMAGKFTRARSPIPLMYWSLNEGRILKRIRKRASVLYDPSETVQVMNTIPPIYKHDCNSLDFNGRNK